jgi:hypothetical protein
MGHGRIHRYDTIQTKDRSGSFHEVGQQRREIVHFRCHGRISQFARRLTDLQTVP